MNRMKMPIPIKRLLIGRTLSGADLLREPKLAMAGRHIEVRTQPDAG
jgi:hypothetical protein